MLNKVETCTSLASKWLRWKVCAACTRSLSGAAIISRASAVVQSWRILSGLSGGIDRIVMSAILSAAKERQAGSRMSTNRWTVSPNRN